MKLRNIRVLSKQTLSSLLKSSSVRDSKNYNYIDVPRNSICLRNRGIAA